MKRSKPVQISVVIPFRDKERALTRTLDSVKRVLSLGVISEVIVVVDGIKVTNAIKSTYEFCEFIVISGKNGAERARNIGSQKAKSDWLLFIDADMKFEPSTLMNALPCLDSYDYIAFKCKVEERETENFMVKYFTERAFNFESHFKNKHYGGAGFLLVRKQIYLELMNTRYLLYSGEDNLFGKKVYKKGYKMTFCSKETVWHSPKSLRSHIFGKIRKIAYSDFLSFLYPSLYPPSQSPIYIFFKSMKNIIYFLVKPYKLKYNYKHDFFEAFAIMLINQVIFAMAAIRRAMLIRKFKLFKIFKNSKSKLELYD